MCRRRYSDYMEKIGIQITPENFSNNELIKFQEGEEEEFVEVEVDEESQVSWDPEGDTKDERKPSEPSRPTERTTFSTTGFFNECSRSEERCEEQIKRGSRDCPKMARGEQRNGMGRCATLEKNIDPKRKGSWFWKRKRCWKKKKERRKGT